MRLRVVPVRHVEGRRRRRLDVWKLVALVHFARHLPGRPVHARAGHLPAPRFGVAPDRAEVGGEHLAGEAALAHVRHLILHARLVLRRPSPRRVREDLSRLRVVAEGAIQRRIRLAGANHHRRRVVEDDVLGNPSEEAPCGVQTSAHVLHRLREGRPDVHVPARRQRHDQCPEPPRLAVGVGHGPHQPEVDLGFLPGRGIVEPHRRCLLPLTELPAREATQRRVRDHDTVACQQVVHSNHAQRGLAVEPRLDLRPTTLSASHGSDGAGNGRACTPRPTAPATSSVTRTSVFTPPVAACSRYRPTVLRSSPSLARFVAHSAPPDGGATPLVRLAS